MFKSMCLCVFVCRLCMYASTTLELTFQDRTEIFRNRNIIKGILQADAGRKLQCRSTQLAQVEWQDVAMTAFDFLDAASNLHSSYWPYILLSPFWWLSTYWCCVSMPVVTAKCHKIAFKECGFRAKKTPCIYSSNLKRIKQRQNLCGPEWHKVFCFAESYTTPHAGLWWD